MFNSSAIYTVHENATAEEAEERVLLVREAFSFWAFVLSPVWLLAHRLWLVFFCYLVLGYEILRIGHYLFLPPISLLTLLLGMHLLIGFYACDLLRDKLSHQGYREVGVISAINEIEAQRRALASFHSV